MLHVTFVGNLGGDAETKDVEKTTVTNFNVATKSTIDKDAEPIWLRCAMWGTRGDKIAEFLTKGKMVQIVGTLVPREYEDKEKNARVSYDVRVDQLELLGGGKDKEERAASGGNGGRGGRSASPPSKSRGSREARD